LFCKPKEKVSDVSQTISYADLKNNFQNPPAEYGVNCWWWWLNGNVNKAAITKDLEAMKSRNFQGAMIFDAGGHNQRGNKDIPKGPLFGSDEWNELFVFALMKPNVWDWRLALISRVAGIWAGRALHLNIRQNRLPFRKPKYRGTKVVQ
jgi:hypothetical protein